MGLDAEARGGRWRGRWKQCTETAHPRSLAVTGEGAGRRQQALGNLSNKGDWYGEEEEAEKARN